MDEVARDFLVSLAVFATIFGIVYLLVTTRYRERMTMLEKGVDPSIFASKEKGSPATLKFGMLAVGIALGIIVGNALERSFLLDEAAAYFAMTFLFGGISLILNYIIDRKLRS